MAQPVLTSGDLNLQVNPTFSGVLDKRSYGSKDNRPSYVGGGLMRYEYDNEGGTLLYHNGTTWVNVTTGGQSFPNLGYLDQDPYIYFWDSGQYTQEEMINTTLPRWFLRYQAGINALDLNGQRLRILESWDGGTGEVNRVLMEAINHQIYFYSTVNFMGTSVPSTVNMSVSSNGVVIADKEFKVTNRIQCLQNETIILNNQLTIQGGASLLYAEGDAQVDGDLTVSGAIKVYDDLSAQYIDVTTTAITPALLGKAFDGVTPIDVTMTTNQAIGYIPKGLSVSTLVNDSNYNTVQKLLAKMLKIGPEELASLVASGQKLFVRYTGTGLGAGSSTQHLKIGSTLQNLQLVIDYNRGFWTPTQTSGIAWAYGRLTGVLFTEPFTGSPVAFSIPNSTTQATSNDITIVSNLFLTSPFQLPTTLTTYLITDIMSASIAQGDNAFNKTLGPFFTPANPSRSMTNNFHFKTYAEVFVVHSESVFANNAAGDPSSDGYSSLSSTTRVFADTTEIISCNLNASHILSIPFTNTFELYQYSELLGRRFNLQQNTEQELIYTVTPVTRTINSLSVQYYDIAFTVTSRNPADIKISLNV